MGGIDACHGRLWETAGIGDRSRPPSAQPLGRRALLENVVSGRFDAAMSET